MNLDLQYIDTRPLVPLAVSPSPSTIGCASGECRVGLAGGQWQAGLVVGARFQDTAQDALVGTDGGRALIHPVKSPLSQTRYPFQLKAVLGKKHFNDRLGKGY